MQSELGTNERGEFCHVTRWQPIIVQLNSIKINEKHFVPYPSLLQKLEITHF